MKLTAVFSLALIGLLMDYSIANAQSVRDQLEVRTGKAELVFPGMQAQEVASKIKEAVSQWSIPANLNYRSMPSVLPSRPDEPVSVQQMVMGAPVVEYQCQTAYGEITKRPPAVKNAFAVVVEQLQVCVYPFQKGTKAYLLFTRAKSTESMTAGLFNGITKAIQGSDEDRMEKMLGENIAEIKKGIPDFLIEKIEIPGKPVSEPDKAAVAALIPAKVESPVAAPLAPMASTAAVSAASPVRATTQAKIEARKSLTATGMAYHDHEQFLSAVRRKDDVAVQLFVDAGGVDLSKKDVDGKTALELAQSLGAVDIIAILEAAKNPVKPNASAAPAKLNALNVLSVQDKQVALLEAERQLGPKGMANVEDSLAKWYVILEKNGEVLTPERRQSIREEMVLNSARALADVKKLADKMKSLSSNQ